MGELEQGLAGEFRLSMTSQLIASRVLVVEDDADLCALLAKGLRRAGFDVVEAQTGEQALWMLRDPGQQIGGLITDIRLPGVINGWVVGSEFNLSHPLRQVVYISGVEQDSASKRAANSIFLRKPVGIRELVTTMKRLANSYAEQHSLKAPDEAHPRPLRL